MDAISSDGISLSFFLAFVEEHKDRLEGLSTQQVCDDVIKPATADQSCSFTALMKTTTDSQHVGSATLFVSHAWMCDFADLVDAVRQWSLRDDQPIPESFLWIDIFSVDQHKDGIKDFTPWNSQFKEVLKSIGNALVVLSPWEKPTWLRRVWCLYEFYTLEMIGIKPIFMLPAKDKAGLDMTLQDDQPYQILSQINFEEAEAWDEDEERLIKELIHAEAGHASVNQMVINALREWLLPITKEALDRMDPSLRPLSDLHFARAELLRESGLSDEAFAMQNQRLNAQTQSPDPAHDWKLADTKHSVALLLTDLGQPEEALRLYLDALKVRRTARTKGRFTMAESLDSVGNVYQDLGRFDEALGMYAEALEVKRRLHGADHVSLSATLSNIGNVRLRQGRHAEALDRYREALRIDTAALGADHVSCAATMKNMGIVHDELGRRGDALDMYAAALRIETAALGAGHPSCAATLKNIGIVYDEQGRLDEALEVYGRALNIETAALGAGHPGCASTLSNMSLVLRRQGRLGEALAVAERALAIEAAALGPRSPAAADTRYNLALLLRELGRAAEARAAFAEAAAVYAEAYGPADPRAVAAAEAAAGGAAKDAAAGRPAGKGAGGAAGAAGATPPGGQASVCCRVA